MLAPHPNVCQPSGIDDTIVYRNPDRTYTHTLINHRGSGAKELRKLSCRKVEDSEFEFDEEPTDGNRRVRKKVLTGSNEVDGTEGKRTTGMPLGQRNNYNLPAACGASASYYLYYKYHPKTWTLLCLLCIHEPTSGTTRAISLHLFQVVTKSKHCPHQFCTAQ